MPGLSAGRGINLCIYAFDIVLFYSVVRRNNTRSLAEYNQMVLIHHLRLHPLQRAQLVYTMIHRIKVGNDVPAKKNQFPNSITSESWYFEDYVSYFVTINSQLENIKDDTYTLPWWWSFLNHICIINLKDDFVFLTKKKITCQLQLRTIVPYFNGFRWTSL